MLNYVEFYYYICYYFYICDLSYLKLYCFSPVQQYSKTHGYCCSIIRVFKMSIQNCNISLIVILQEQSGLYSSSDTDFFIESPSSCLSYIFILLLDIWITNKPYEIKIKTKHKIIYYQLNYIYVAFNLINILLIYQ